MPETEAAGEDEDDHSRRTRGRSRAGNARRVRRTAGGEAVRCEVHLGRGHGQLAEGQFTVGYFSSPSDTLIFDGSPSAISRRLCLVGHYANSPWYGRKTSSPIVISRR